MALPLQSSREPPYLSKKDAVRTVNHRTVRDYFYESDGSTMGLYALAAVLGTIFIVLEPIVRLYRFVAYRCRSTQAKNNLCKNTQPSEGLIHLHTCPKTGRHYVTRHLDRVRDAVDVPYLFASGFAVDAFAKYIKPETWVRHRYASPWYRIQMESPDVDVVVQEWEEQEKIVGAALMVQRPHTFWSELMETAEIAAFILRLMFVAPRTACRLCRIVFALVWKGRQVMSCFNKPICLLKFLAVEKGFQGQGIGSNLLKTLESSSPANVPLYERFGFRVFEEYHCTPDCPPLYLMIRAPETTPHSPATTTTAQDASTMSSPETSPDVLPRRPAVVVG